jgi:transposase-like protein
MLGGPGKILELDDAFIGGKKRRKGVKAGKEAKITILGIAERGGRVHMQVIPNMKALAIRPVLKSRIHPETEKIVTDSHATYAHTIPTDKHEPHSHKDELRDDGFISSTRTIETAFSLFKRGIVGTYHKLSPDHLDSFCLSGCFSNTQ